MAGRKPLPSSIQDLKGAYRKNPQRRPRNEPEFTEQDAECPDHLGPVAKAEWVRMYPELKAAGLMRAAYMAAFAAYCQNYERWAMAEKEVQAQGLIVGGYPNPYLAIASKAMDQMRSFLTEFGMTPSSKTRAVADKREKQEESRFAKLAKVVSIAK